MRLVKAVLFDLDGTLVDSLPELYHGVHTVLSDMGLKAPSQEAVGAMIGRGILVLVQRLCAALGIAVESEQGRDLFDRLLKAWSESGGRHMAFYPGVIEGVEQLKGAPVRADDLRAGAAMIIAGLIAKGTTEIEEISHIDRGYENIVEKLTGLGADIRRVDRPEPDDISRAV